MMDLRSTWIMIERFFLLDCYGMIILLKEDLTTSRSIISYLMIMWKLKS